MTNNKLDNATHTDLFTNKNVKLQKKLHELKEEQKAIHSPFYRSFLSLMGYIVAGVALWSLMHWQFGLAFPGNVDVPNDKLRFKDIWNAAMYVVPYCFWGMAAKNACIMLITLLNICCIEFELYLVKRKLAK
uniref:Conjugal transfer protein TrbF n=1 Tax=Pectobacterium carotovorum TaxID=554 RepID=A0A0N9MZN3_PECCA|nr:hypothetical protein [Pectobacterium carotovorum]ALG88465.1 conjugal transfer protein TrbF [Pectobacterium carotovorum]